MPRLQIIIASTRPGRVGLPVADWFTDRAEAHGGFELDVVDHGVLGLAFMDEPNHPRLRRYEHQHTKDWSVRVDAADAFVFVAPEYNYGFSAPLKNALDFLHEEWRYKAVGFVSYGGISAGTRAVQLLKPVLTGLKLVAVTEAVNIPFVRQFLDDEEVFRPNEVLEQAADAMLDELVKVDSALRALRAPQAANL
jgi:NAD(P)H-dependent FMN reductase